MKRWFTLLFALLASVVGGADFDYGLAARQIAPGVYVFVGRTEDFNTENGGNIVNTGFIVGRDGVVVIDTGPSLRYGQQMRQAISKVTKLPVTMTFNTHHHPDHFLGNQAFTEGDIVALAGARQGIASDGNAFAENLFRMTGDWMKGTEVAVPNRSVDAGTLAVAGRKLRLIALDGHTGADLAIYDEASGVLFAGDLVFNNRAPTTPHARVPHWLASLDKLETLTREPGFKLLVPGHGEIAQDAAPIRATRAWLVWLDRSLRESATAGLDMNEVLARPLPAEFARMPVAATEYRRSVGHLFPAIEQEALEHDHRH